MFENRNLKLDLAALTLLAVVVFLGLSLATYQPADAVSGLAAPFDQIYTPDQIVHPQNEVVANGCGRWGALAADMLLHGFGVGAYYIVFSLAVLDALMLRRFEIDTPLLRVVGWIISLIGLVSLVALVAPGYSPGPVVGSGGYAGALSSSLIKMHFATLGGLVLCVSMIAGGVMLCTDYAIVRVVVTGGGVLLLGASNGRQWWSERRVGDRGSDDDDDASERLADGVDEQDVEEELDEEIVAVRIRGRRALAASGGPEYEEEEEEDEDWDDEEEGEDEQDQDDRELDDDEEEDYDEEVDEIVVAPPTGKRVKSVRRARTDAGHPPTPRRIRQPAAAERQPSERELVMHQLDEASHEEPSGYELPDVELLHESDDIDFEKQTREVRRKAKILEKTFSNFGFNVKVVEIETGPVIAQYEVQLEAGLRLSKITGLADDLAIALRVPSVRIVAPIPGKNTVGIEVPNSQRQMVRLREVFQESSDKAAKMRIPIFLGKDVSGNPLCVDLSAMPHLLIAGRTGTGKSVCLNAIISSILMTKRPDEVRMLMIDPKMVELSGYGRLPHLMHPVVTDMKKAEAILAWAVEKMEERYKLLAKAGVRHICSYNQLDEEELHDRLQPEDDEEWRAIPQHLPFIVIVADEIADMMMTAGKEVEQHIIRLAQKSRAVGIHLILATQKPTVDVITGLIKSNLPARIAFQVASRTDSRVVLDEMGADKLLGHGDMLFLWPGTSTLLRGQGTYLGDDEINAIVDTVSTGEQNFVSELLNMKVESQGSEELGQLKKRDELYEQAVDVVIGEGRGSVSLLQRALGIGYGRAARLVDFMAEDGIVGPYAGSQAREVAISIADWEQMKAGGSEDPQPEPAVAKRVRRPASSKAVRPGKKRRRRNVVLPAADEWDDASDTSAAAARRTASDELLDDAELDEGLDQQTDDATQSGKEALQVFDEADDDDSQERGELENDQYEEDQHEEDEYEEDEYEEDEYEEDEYEEDEYAANELAGEEQEEEEQEEEEQEEEDEYEEDEYEEEEYEEEEYEEEEYEEEDDDEEHDVAAESDELFDEDEDDEEDVAGEDADDNYDEAELEEDDEYEEEFEAERA